LQVFVGLYNEMDLTRLTAIDAVTGEQYENDLFPLSLSGNFD
jgi:hypothetical protein